MQQRFLRLDRLNLCVDRLNILFCRVLIGNVFGFSSLDRLRLRLKYIFINLTC